MLHLKRGGLSDRSSERERSAAIFSLHLRTFYRTPSTEHLRSSSIFMPVEARVTRQHVASVAVVE
jgi:hypothetical protein